MNTSWTGRRRAEPLLALRRLAAAALAAMALGTMLPAHAFQKTSLADGSFEYFFAAPSLDIRGPGDLDLGGLSFIEGVSDGFRVGALFNLDWLGGEQATLESPLSSWNGLDTLPRSLSIIAGGNLGFGTTRLSLEGGTISLAAGGYLNVGNGSMIDFGGSGGAVIGNPGLAVPPAPTSGGITLVSGGSGSGAIINWDWAVIRNPGFVDPPAVAVLSRIGGSDPSVIFPVGTLTPNPVLLIEPSGTITPAGPSPIPEPDVTALLLAGLLALAGLRMRHANAER
ncbi:MAG: hypothetical protein ABIK82_01400 [Pseudomonadota bacterium]